jgi:hypothetical protein
MKPETRYALSGDVHIAYQLSGDGPFDLVFVPGFVTHMELQWKLPGFAEFLADLGSFARLIRFDKRGRACPTQWPAPPVWRRVWMMSAR